MSNLQKRDFAASEIKEDHPELKKLDPKDVRRLFKDVVRFLDSEDNSTFKSEFDDPLHLINELRTFQVELELQNAELHRSQQELMKSQIRYTELYDFAPVGYITIDPKGLILNANLTFTEMLQTQRSLLINQPFHRFVMPKDQDILYQHLRHLSDQKTKQICELCMKKEDGSCFDVQLESAIIQGEKDCLEHSRIVVIDISERKQLENERQILEASLQKAHKMKSIGTIAGGVAHDFNNILQIILGNVELLCKNIPEWDDSSHSNLKAIHKSVRKAKNIIKTLLKFSRKTDQKLSPVNILSVIEEALEFLRSSIPTTIELHKNFPDHDVMILADKIQIGQILMSLCTNAAKAMEKTGGVININGTTESLSPERAALYPTIEAGDYFKLTIGDTGPGIDPDIIDQVFDPYFTTQGVGQASGMGLAVVHGIVRNHHGAITVKSRSGEGAVFSILLPIIVAEEKLVIEPEEIGQNVQGLESILFVDDEEYIKEIAQKALPHFGYQVEAFMDPDEALEVFESKPNYFDLVVSDMTMPKMTGVQLFKELKHIRSDIPFIICTGHSDYIDEEKARSLGIDGFLMKPMSISNIVKLIRYVLDHQGQSSLSTKPVISSIFDL